MHKKHLRYFLIEVPQKRVPMQTKLIGDIIISIYKVFVEFNFLRIDGESAKTRVKLPLSPGEVMKYGRRRTKYRRFGWPRRN